MDMSKKRLLIVGGVAGGASCAARARRLSEDGEIIVFERGAYVSFANCGIPYYVGKLITEEKDLFIASPGLFRERFNIDVRIQSNVRRIDRNTQEIEIENLENGRVYRESYDALVLSPGSVPLKPDIDGIDMPGIFSIWTIPDMRDIIRWIDENKVKKAAVVGGGFIGLEMTENLRRLGISVTIIEMQQQVMPALDPEMASFIHDHLIDKDVELRLGNAVSRFEKDVSGGLLLTLKPVDPVSVTTTVSADMVILAAGVRPRTELAAAAGLVIGSLGGIVVDDRMQTGDPHIWAVGDAVEVEDFVTHVPIRTPLAGSANRQGRIAADVILGSAADGPRPSRFRGSQTTAVCGVIGMTIASTGATEKFLIRTGDTPDRLPFEKIYLHPDHHAGYYPGAQTISIKMLFSKNDGRILGAQAVGFEGVEKRIDVIAMAIQNGATVFDLEEAELCYAPQYGSARDPVNLAGMIAANVIRGYSSVVHWADLDPSDVFILDVRDRDEFEKGYVENAVNIPLNELRERMSELPLDREIWIHCLVGQRSYIAERILNQNGYNVRNISGGYIMYQAGEKTKSSR